MVKRYSDSASQVHYGFASGGQNPDDTCPLEGMQVKNRIPGKHGELVKDEHLAFSNIMIPFGQQHIEAPVADKGATTICVQMAGLPGTNHSVPIGTIPQQHDPDGATQGNSPFSYLIEKYKEGSGTKIPPKSRKVDNYYEIIEKNIQHSLSLLDGISSTGAQWPIAGMKDNGLQQVATAKEQFNNILNSDVLSSLPGSSFQIGNLLDIMPQGLQDELFANMPSSVQRGLNNALQMMSDSESNDTGGYMTGGRVNTDTYLPNVVSELKDVKTSGEMMEKLQKVNGDQSLRGMDEFDDIIMAVEGAFGFINQVISTDENGNISVGLDIPDAIANLQDVFSSLLTQLPGAGAASGGTFANANFGDMLPRLPPNLEQVFNQQLQSHVDSQSNPVKARLNAFREKTFRQKTN